MRNLRMFGMFSLWHVIPLTKFLYCGVVFFYSYNVFSSFFYRGIGVIGEQPVILPNNSFEYSSACPLTTPSGRMVSVYFASFNSVMNKYSSFLFCFICVYSSNRMVSISEFDIKIFLIIILEVTI